jgi:hypothetical protein
LRAFSGSFPRQFAFENHRLLWPAAVIQQAQELSRFAGATVIQIVKRGNMKNGPACEETVDDESSLWKDEENLE